MACASPASTLEGWNASAVCCHTSPVKPAAGPYCKQRHPCESTPGRGPTATRCCLAPSAARCRPGRAAPRCSCDTRGAPTWLRAGRTRGPAACSAGPELHLQRQRGGEGAWVGGTTWVAEVGHHGGGQLSTQPRAANQEASCPISVRHSSSCLSRPSSSIQFLPRPTHPCTCPAAAQTRRCPAWMSRSRL